VPAIYPGGHASLRDAVDRAAALLG
jgi:hypothetical protein